MNSGVKYNNDPIPQHKRWKMFVAP